MRFKSLKIAKLLSFGPLQELNDFKNFNLFIGKNGSGKSNIFRILQGLSVSYQMMGEKIMAQYSTHRGGLQISNVNVFTPEIYSENHHNRDGQMGDIKGLIEIDYEEITDIYQKEPLKKKIKFEDDVDRTIRYIEGDINFLSRAVKYIELPKSEFEFYKDLALFFGSRASGYLPLLNFGLFYIFGLHYNFLQNGTFTQGKRYMGGNVEENTINLPSGVLNCAKILTRYLMSVDKQIILIDEPELYLEPRIIRKLFHFLVWLNVKDSLHKTLYEKNITEFVEAVLTSNWNEELGISYWAITNGEIEGKQNYSDINSIKIPQKQLFIASHSSIFINEFLNFEENASIYAFDLKEMSYLNVRPSFNSDNPFAEEFTPTKGLFTNVTKIESNVHCLLDNLGCKGSDLLQTNGVIWVEGPSDVIYIKKWLEMYANEKKSKQYIQGRNYEFQMFGGTILDSICMINLNNDEEGEYKKLVSMFSFSKNAFVVIDGDAVIKEDGSVIDQSKFKNAKLFIKNQFEILSQTNYKLGLWYKEGVTEIRTMEDYLDKTSLELKNANKWTKKIAAQKITESWDIETKKLDEFPNGLLDEIEILYNMIADWNG